MIISKLDGDTASPRIFALEIYFWQLATKNYEKADIKTFCSCPILLVYLTFGHIFCTGLQSLLTHISRN